MAKSQTHGDCKSDVQTRTPFPTQTTLTTTKSVQNHTDAGLHKQVEAINFHNNDTQSQTSWHQWTSCDQI